MSQVIRFIFFNWEMSFNHWLWGVQLALIYKWIFQNSHVQLMLFELSLSKSLCTTSSSSLVNLHCICLFNLIKWVELDWSWKFMRLGTNQASLNKMSNDNLEWTLTFESLLVLQILMAYLMVIDIRCYFWCWRA